MENSKLVLVLLVTVAVCVVTSVPAFKRYRVSCENYSVDLVLSFPLPSQSDRRRQCINSHVQAFHTKNKLCSGNGSVLKILKLYLSLGLKNVNLILFSLYEPHDIAAVANCIAGILVSHAIYIEQHTATNFLFAKVRRGWRRISVHYNLIFFLKDLGSRLLQHNPD